MPHHDPFTLDDLDTLLEWRAGPCVSLFLPTARVTADTDRDRIQLGNLRSEAFERLVEEGGLRRPDAEALLLPVDELLEDEEFWPYLSDGLAIFLGPGAHFVFRVAEPLEPRLAVGDRFLVKPLVPLLSGDGTYHALALSRNEVRVLEGTRMGAREVQVDELPRNMAKALTRRGREGERGMNKQWQGDEGQKTLYRKYFLEVDRVLRPLYAGRSEPLVLAGVDYLLPIFREATSYRHLVPEGIHGNPEDLSAAEIHTRAWPLVEPILDAPRRAALEALEGLRGTDRVTDDVSTILGAAHDGRVECLFIDVGVDLFGTFDSKTRETVVTGSEAKASDVDLIAAAARWVYGRGGTVFAASDEAVSAERPIAAVMRY